MSEKSYKKVIKFWSVLRLDEIERWLEEQAAEGWILQNRGLSKRVFHFKKDKPVKMRFSIDYRFMKHNVSCTESCTDKNWAVYRKCRAWTIRGMQYDEVVPDNTDFRKDTLKNYKTRTVILLITAVSMLTGALFSIKNIDELYRIHAPHYITFAALLVLAYTFYMNRQITNAVSALVMKGNSNYKKIFKFWFAWNADKLEKWLGEQAAEGWILKEVNFNITTFWFVKSEPAKISFATDFQNRTKDEYFSIAEDSGWKHYKSNCGWHLWSKEYEGEDEPVFFSDSSSLVKKFKRLLTFLSAIAVYEYIILYTTITRFIETESLMTKSVCILHFLATAFITWVAVKLFIKMRSFREDSGY